MNLLETRDGLLVAANIGTQRDAVSREPARKVIVLGDEALQPVETLFRLGESNTCLGEVLPDPRLLLENEFHRLFNVHLELPFQPPSVTSQ